MKKSIVLHPDMGAEVVNHLRQFGDLPAKGILAGQAVDSAITDLYGSGGGVYNDLDVFRKVPRQGGRSDIYAMASFTAQRSELDLRKQSGYGGMALIMETLNSYNIKSVSRQGMLNFVNCTMGDGHLARPLTSQRVLAGFDLNCTRVAVDLSTNELYWDRHYEEFLRSRQLRIAMMHTPWHTLLRLTKKAQELPNVFVDYEAAAMACVGVANSHFISKMLYDRDLSLKFGKKYSELAESTRHQWGQYFTLESKVLRRGPGKAWSESVSESQADKTVELFEMTPRGALEAPLQRRCDMLSKGVLFFAQKVVDEHRRAKPGNAKQKLTAISAHRAKVAEKPELDYVLRCAKLFGSDYVQGQAIPEVADKVAEWLKKHSFFTKHLLGLSLSQQHACMQSIMDVSREFGKQYYEGDAEAALGVLETQASLYDVQSPERMFALLKADYDENNKPFDVKPLLLPATLPAEFEGFHVQELLTPTALLREGKDMHHCVGGYSSAVSTGRSRILRIKFGKETTSLNCSTVEVTGNFNATRCLDMDLRMVQNRAIQNKAPSQKNQEFVEFLVNYLSVADEVGSMENLRETAYAAIADGIEAQKALNLANDKVKAMQDSIREMQQELQRLQSQSYTCSDMNSARKRRADFLAKLAGVPSSEVEVMRNALKRAHEEDIIRAREARLGANVEALPDQEDFTVPGNLPKPSVFARLKNLFYRVYQASAPDNINEVEGLNP